MQKRTSYEKAISYKYPEQIVIGIAKEAAGKCNPITLGWTMITSHQPPMMAVSIGLTRYSHEVFRRADEFVIAMPSGHQADEAMFFGTRSGRDCDKFAEAGTNLQAAAKVDCVLMADAVANFELRKVGEMTTGDHVIFAGEVICSHVNKRKLNRLYTVSTDFKMAGLPRED
ncbi:MAG: flavin reductase family protein [Planctomycetota bacterium]|jgi:flavin reductase (DIM6/NTAB) family NADH-FMN oxidoreductase RutF